MPRKRITIKLSEQDEQSLKKYVSQGQKNAREINRARILLLTHDGLKIKEIAQALGVSQATICNVRNNYNRQDYDHILDVIKDNPRSGRPLKLDSRLGNSHYGLRRRRCHEDTIPENSSEKICKKLESCRSSVKGR